MTNHGRILVSGGGGFVGQHLIKRLMAEGSPVTCILKGREIPEPRPHGFDHVEFVWHDGSTSNMQSIVASARPDTVYHLASLFISEHVAQDIEPLVASNILFGTQLLEALTRAGHQTTSFVNVGTSWEHFRGSAYDPVNLYAATKAAFEDILVYYVNVTGLRAVTLKLFDTYGPNDRRPKLINLLGTIAENGEPLMMSPGEQMLDLVHVEDVVSALLAGDRGLANGTITPGAAYAVSSGRRLSLREVVEVYQSATGTTVSARWGERPYRTREVMKPWATGESVPDWQPQWTLEAGFKQIGEGR